MWKIKIQYKLKANKRMLLFAVIAAAIIGLKLSISMLGYNNDIEIWKYVSDAMSADFLRGRVIYTYTQFYNHGPIRSYALGLMAFVLKQIGHHETSLFHVWIVFFLSISDLLIGILLWKIYGRIPAIIFLLNPVSLLITGYHSQIGSTAIMLGLLSWFIFLKAKDLYKDNNPKYRRLLIISALILGVSLGIKHILIFFPVYIFLIHKRHSIFKFKDIVIFIFIAYFIFFGLFGVEILRDSFHPMATTFRNIKLFVFEYRSGGLYGQSSFAQLINLFMSKTYVERYFSWLPLFKGYSFFFVAGIFTYGVLVINKIKSIKFVFPLYLLAMFSFSPSLADQYLAVPLIAMSVYYNNIISFIYFMSTYLYLARGPSANISGQVRYSLNLLVGDIKIPFFPWNISNHFQVTYSQAWAILLMFIILIQMYDDSHNFRWSKIMKNYLSS